MAWGALGGGSALSTASRKKQRPTAPVPFVTPVGLAGEPPVGSKAATGIVWTKETKLIRSAMC